ncbi:response regulator transcription factor [Paenibacillus harenae]|uniref:response regulator transcription factor n=1 Tax=Paenibacillus harenae TaxID=306543 RepID=UPI0004290E32|nr:response regulator [Paenibacillus harenae]
MTYRILIVDDESVDLEWMRRRIQSSGKRLEVAAAVDNVYSALDVVRKEQIDIILSDIRMPIMSGMELIRQVKEIRSHIRVMFVSGHKEFEYAKQAVDFNAFGYLLKPVEDHELSHKLDAVIADLDKEQDRNEERLKLKETFSLVKQEMLFRWLEGDNRQLSAQAAIMLEEEVQAYGTAAAVIEIDQFDWRTTKNADSEWQELYLKISRFVEGYVADRRWGYCIHGEQQRKTLILFGDENTHGARTDELIAEVGKLHPLTISIGLGFHTENLRELPLSYQAAKTALGTKWHAGKNKTLTLRDSEVDTLSHNPDEKWPEIVKALADYNLTTIDDWIELLFNQGGVLESKGAVFQHLIHSIVKLNEQFHALNENFDELMEWETPFPNNLLEFETALDLKSWLRRKFFAFSEKWYLKKQKQKRKLILEIMQYVEDQIERKITLKKAADHFGFSTNYLGYLYKQETGQHFNSYINEQRIKKACQLLQDPKLKVFEISESIGYRNIIYFNRQFKQVTGMSPGDYRKRLNI